VEVRNAYIRVINLSSTNVIVNSKQGDITSNLNSNFIDSYKDITTCDAMSLDRIILKANNEQTDTIFMSFDIYKKYSMFVFDTENKVGGKIIGVPPIDDRIKPQVNQAIVRVVNGNILENGITVSIGARDANNDWGYESGITLAVNLLAGEYSKEMFVNAGVLPVSIFASTQPTKYMFSSIIYIESGKEYIIAVDGLGTGNIAVIEVNDEAIPIQYNETGSFLQIANVCNGNNILNFTIPNIIANGKLSNYNMLTTFIPVTNNYSVKVASNIFNFNTTINERTLLIAASDPDNPTLFAVQNANMGASNNSLRFRFVNASDDTQMLLVDTVVNIDDKKDTTFNVFNNNIEYKSASVINSNARDRKYSFRFVNQATGKPLYKANDLLMTLNKNYTIIFYGNSNKNIGYGIFIVQEY